MYKFLILFSLLGFAVSAPASRERSSYGKVRSNKDSDSDEYDVPAYKFVWAVKDDESYNDFGQEESRDGDDTKGSYHVLLPDGRRQIVTYTVNGDSGFLADVAYEGERSSGSGEKTYVKRQKKVYVKADSDSQEKVSHTKKKQPSSSYVNIQYN